MIASVIRPRAVRRRGLSLATIASIAVLALTGARRSAGAQTASCTLASATPREAGVDVRALDSLTAAARASGSDALLVMRHGRIVREWYADSGAVPISIRSATKPIVGLLVLKLVEEHRIRSLDQPVADFYPEWRQGRKRVITVRQLLTHTSGLQNVPNAGVELEAAPDAVRLALAAELDAAPGSTLSYNNKAVALLAGIIERAAGMPMERYAAARLWAPLCMAPPMWDRDSAGTANAYSGLSLDARSLAKVGQVVLDRGVWRGRSLLDSRWIDSLSAQSQPWSARLGLLWLRLPVSIDAVIDTSLVTRWRTDTVATAFATRVAPLVGRRVPADSFAIALDGIFGAGRGAAALERATTHSQ